MTNITTIKLSGDLEIVDINLIIPYAKNIKIHNEQQISMLQGSMKLVGYVQEICIDENGLILCGHGRWEAILKQGTQFVEVRRVKGLTETQKEQYRIMDNTLNSYTGYKDDTLKELLLKLKADGINLNEMAIGDTVLAKLSDEDEINPLRTESDKNNDLDIPKVSRKGDLWLLGKHRLYCGDSLDTKSYDILMNGTQATMIFCDPPYNVSIASISKQHTEDAFAMAKGEMSQNEFIEFLSKYMQLCHDNSVDGSIHYHCMDHRHQLEIMSAIKQVYGDTGYKNTCVWVKDLMAMGSFYRQQHEFIYVAKKGNAGNVANFILGNKERDDRYGKRNRSNVWNYPMASSYANEDNKREKNENDNLVSTGNKWLKAHPTPKPTILVREAIIDCSNEGGIILDTFLGSGTTLIACQQVNRICYGIEFEPEYCDVILERFLEETKEEPRLLRDYTEIPYSKVKQERI